jgi:hypothetical protein
LVYLRLKKFTGTGALNTNKMDGLTYGQKAVGLSFNPSGDDKVAQCKQGFATEIDRMNDLRSSSESQEQKRLCSIAITELQTAQMWAVKALTWKD